jgi:hypothetical protein
VQSAAFHRARSGGTLVRSVWGIVACAATVAFLSSCTISQSVKPVARDGLSEICIVVNPHVRPGFLDTYIRVLSEKGYLIKQLPPDSGTNQCPTVSAYTGSWSWDLALYLSYAEIVVYRNGRRSGQAIYDSRRGGGNMNKFIKADKKIAELVDELFPDAAQR